MTDQSGSSPGRVARIVCLAGSAGALKAYQEILRHLPIDSGMAFVIASHRGLEFRNLLTEVLSLATAMPVLEVEHGMRLVPNQVFVMPPRVEMMISDDRLILKEPTKRWGWPVSISVFLHSLAASAGARAVVIILSGSGYDGSSELGAIKAAGGVTFAQSDPQFRDMPDHAVKTGHVDFVLPPADIAKGLLALAA